MGFINAFTVSEKSQETSYLVAKLITQKRKKVTQLVRPVCKIIVGKMLGEDATRKVENIPLWDNAIKIETYAHFQQNNQRDFSKGFANQIWVQMLADDFHLLNQPNKLPHGGGENTLTSNVKIPGFERKLKLLKNHAVKGNLDVFELLSGFKSED
ncbi:hypothetical protein NPIL_422181 [Nephila pilipes]|uniref:Uncharacterized protein n=1 Tax=Nephila pilipes TaxID=299642 RepID=A0A8X6NAJ8_NEPPI|nr:hypothetical protein NPIL_422181 [Nephila pilipes]